MRFQTGDAPGGLSHGLRLSWSPARDTNQETSDSPSTTESAVRPSSHAATNGDLQSIVPRSDKGDGGSAWDRFAASDRIQTIPRKSPHVANWREFDSANKDGDSDRLNEKTDDDDEIRR